MDGWQDTSRVDRGRIEYPEPYEPMPLDECKARPEIVRRTPPRRARRCRVHVECNECHKKWTRNIGPNTYELRCPRCRSYDTEPF